MNSFPSKAAQKNALDSLNRQYSAVLHAIPNYYSLELPFDLCHWRAKHDAHVSKDVALKIKGLIVAREAAKAMPIVKPLSQKQERAERLNLRFGENNSLKSELLKQAPRLAANFEDGWRKHIAKCLARGDDKLNYENAGWRAPRDLQARRSHWEMIVSYHGFVQVPSNRIDDAKLAQAAKEYGARIALGWYEKMATKLGTATEVSVVENSLSANIEIRGNIAGHAVRVTQQIVFKMSSLGRPFHQFPALIYVDGKFTTEEEFAKAFHPEVAA